MREPLWVGESTLTTLTEVTGQPGPSSSDVGGVWAVDPAQNPWSAAACDVAVRGGPVPTVASGRRVGAVAGSGPAAVLSAPAALFSAPGALLSPPAALLASSVPPPSSFPAPDAASPASSPDGGPRPSPMGTLAPVGRLAVAAYRGARHAAGDPRVSGLLRAGPSVALFLARSRERTAVAATDTTVVPVRPTAGLALHAYLDELLIALFRHPELLPKEHDYAPAASDLERLHALFSSRGWIERPTAYHRDPPAPDDLETSGEHRQGLGYEHVTFTSGWEPDPGEPGRDRWWGHEANRTVHAWVARVPGRHRRSWLVCAHGLGMGANGAMDLRAFRAPVLVRRGINVAVPVLPLHGPRASGRVRGEDLMTIDMVDSLHGVAQAVWEMRRVIRWLRQHEGAEQIGIMGYSLGGLVAALVASLEDDLTCVIAGIPVVDLPHLFRRHSPPDIARLADTYGVLGPSADAVHRVVSPLAMRCRVPFDRRFIFAGLADRMSTFGHARRLWLHWGQPALAAYAGGHVGFYWSGAVKRFVDEALWRSYARIPPIAA